MTWLRNRILGWLGLQTTMGHLEIQAHNMVLLAQAYNAVEARVTALETLATSDRLPGEKVH